jgi:hypothetical protein
MVRGLAIPIRRFSLGRGTGLALSLVTDWPAPNLGACLAPNHDDDPEMTAVPR